MNFSFFFISYTVIYAKYNHCYELPRDLPMRYFDGKEWKFMKPRHVFRTKAPRYTNISTELDWADLIKEIKEIEIQETTTQMRPTCARTKTKTKTTEKNTTEKTTRKRTTTKKITTKKTTPKKTTTKKTTTTKITTPKTTIRKVRPLTKPTTTKKAAVKHSPSRCKLKLKTTTTTTIDPRILEMKMLASEAWINAWTRVRPTKKLCPIGQGFLVDQTHCKKLKLETTSATTIDPLIWKKKMITSEDWINVWTRVRPTKKPSPITAKVYTTKNLSATRTKKPMTTIKEPVTKTMKPVTTAEKPVEVSGIRGDEVNGPENWSKLMREFLKFVELKKCRPPCKYRTTTTMPFSGYKLDDKRIRSGADGLTNILMDGVQINDELSEVDDNASQEKALMRFKETYEADTQRLNYDSIEGSVSRESKINNDNVQGLDLNSFKDSVKVRRIKQNEETAQYRKKIALLKELKSNSVKQDYQTPRISQSDAYLDEIKVKNTIEEDEVIQDNEINSNLGVLKDKHTDKEKDSEIKAYLEAENSRNTGKAQDKDIKKRLDTIQDMYTQRYKDNSQYVSKDPLNFKELNRIADYVATKRAYSTDSTEMRNDNEDFLQDRDLGMLEDDHENADKYSTESIEVRDSDVYFHADTVNDINEEEKDDNIKSYENVIPLFNFKYALSENIAN